MRAAQIENHGRMRKTSAQHQTSNDGEWEACSEHVDMQGVSVCAKQTSGLGVWLPSQQQIHGAGGEPAKF